MSSRFITNATDAPTDNFKINTNGQLEKLFGDFLEDLHIWIDEERDRLNLPAFQWFLYDALASGEALNADFEGQTWTVDPSGADTQRVKYTPHTGIRISGVNTFTSGDPTKLDGFDAAIRNYTQDIASGLIPILSRYGGMRSTPDVSGALSLFFYITDQDEFGTQFFPQTSGNNFFPTQKEMADNVVFNMGNSTQTLLNKCHNLRK